MIVLYKSFLKIFIASVLILTILACGRKETPPQPKKQQDPTVSAVTTLFKKWDQAFNTNDPDRLIEIIPNEFKQRFPEETTKKICAGLVSEVTSLVKDLNTSVDRIVIEDNEQTRGTVYVTHAAVTLKTQEPLKDSNSFPITKEAGEWKVDIQKWAETRQTKSAAPESKPAPAEVTPTPVEAQAKPDLVVSLSYDSYYHGYHIISAEVYNGGDKLKTISPSNFVLVTNYGESVEAKTPFESALRSYKNLLNLSILPKTFTSGNLFFKTAPVQKGEGLVIVFLPTGQRIPVSPSK